MSNHHPLRYSSLTDTIYATINGKRHQIASSNFINMVLLWMLRDCPIDTQKLTRIVSAGGKPQYRITLEKIESTPATPNNELPQ